jgi:putative nucleotidyltransferase with HDIG domain
MRQILYIEDNFENKLLVRRLLENAGYQVLEAEDGISGVRVAIENKPDLIIMDINIPGMDGYEATTKIKAMEALANIPIVALTANVMKGDRERSLVAGCDGYMQKPINPDTFVETIEQYLQGQKDEVADTDQRHYLRMYSQKLVDRLEEKILELEQKNRELEGKSREMEEVYVSVISTLTRTIEAKHPKTAGHSERVTRYAVLIGEAMGISKRDLKILRRASMLHDIGKLVVELSFIDKPGELAQEEWQSMRRNPEIAAQILEPLRFLEWEIDIIRKHHERPDGQGYPRGLRHEQLDLLTGILIVADAFDAMTSDRSYREAMDLDESVNKLLEERGAHFMPDVVDVLIRLLREGKLNDILHSADRKDTMTA